MLTNCGDCKFNSEGEGCAVNPNYFETFATLSHLSESQQAAIVPNVESCREFETTPELGEISLTLTMTIRDWKRIANSKQASEHGIAFVEQVRAALETFDPPIQWKRDERSHDIPF